MLIVLENSTLFFLCIGRDSQITYNSVLKLYTRSTKRVFSVAVFKENSYTRYLYNRLNVEDSIQNLDLKKVNVFEKSKSLIKL